MQPFLALITPLATPSQGPVDPGFSAPPGWGAHPAHPIAPGGPPPVPTHPIYNPPGIWPSPGHPAHPIAPGGPPPSIWPSPGHPAHPIVLPPGIWPNPPEGTAPIPEHPIVIPPPPSLPNAPPLQVKVAWTPATGWIVVLVPTGTHPVPSA